MCNYSFFIGGVVDVIKLLWSGEGARSQPHSLYELWVYKVVGGSTVYKPFRFGLVVMCVDRSWYLHRSEAHNVHRITTKCPHPGRRVQACGKSSFLHIVWRIRSFTSSLSFPTPFSHSLALSSAFGAMGPVSAPLALLPSPDALSFCFWTQLRAKCPNF